MEGMNRIKCPKCGSELQKVSSCCSVVYFCEKCNDAVEDLRNRFEEKIYQNSKKKVKKWLKEHQR